MLLTVTLTCTDVNVAPKTESEPVRVPLAPLGNWLGVTVTTTFTGVWYVFPPCGGADTEIHDVLGTRVNWIDVAPLSLLVNETLV